MTKENDTQTMKTRRRNRRRRRMMLLFEYLMMNSDNGFLPLPHLLSPFSYPLIRPNVSESRKQTQHRNLLKGQWQRTKFKRKELAGWVWWWWSSSWLGINAAKLFCFSCVAVYYDTSVMSTFHRKYCCHKLAPTYS